MRTSRRAPALLLLLLVTLLVGACGPQEVVYVVVTATPESNAPGGTGDSNPPGVIGDSSVPLPPAPTEPAGDGGATPLATPATGEATGGAETTESIASSTSLAPPPASVGRIAYMGPYGSNGAFHAFVANADGTGLRFPSERQTEGFFPHLSPDGTRVAFTASNDNGDPDIFVTDLSGGEAINITNVPGQDIQPIWSPDGARIAFVSQREGGDSDIWLMEADGSNPRRLAFNPGEEQLGSWSPDGTQLVFSNRTEIGETLYLIDVESGEISPLTDGNAATESGPAWSPDGELIAFFATADGTSPPQIFTIRPDGTERQQVTNSMLPAVFPVWSPDGEWLAYTTITIIGQEQSLDLVAYNLATEETHPIPTLQGLATSWRPSDEVLADMGITQGPLQSGIEVSAEVLESAYRRGSHDAPVKIIEFSDYQCPFCQRWFNDTLPLLEPYIEDGTVEFIFVDFPLNIHPQAPAAAVAARCAGEQGGTGAYWQMHDLLFINMSQWSGQATPAPIFASLAGNIGLDSAALQSCVESGRYQDEVNAGLQEGIRLGITGTPTFFINGERVVGAQPWEVFAAYLPPTSE